MLRPKSILRDIYLIDRYHVIFESGGGWHCVCDEFTKLNECRHTRESAGRRAAQDLIKARVSPVDGTLTKFANRSVPSAL